MKFTIFYSWQSDLPNNTNRGFLESVLEKAINHIGNDQTFEIEASIDRDTQGTPGSPNISQTIIDKIKSCDVFVADISIVTGAKEQGQRLSPNPNVLIELGYAISSLGWEKIILFCNELYNSDGDLPFDIRQHRRISYHLKPEDEKQPLRDKLSSVFKTGLVEIIQSSTFASKTKRPALTASWNYLGSEIVQCKFQDVTASRIELKRPPSIDGVKTAVERNMNDVRSIDGSLDHKWDSKVSAFIDKCMQFIRQLETKKGREAYLLKSNSKLSKSVTLSVTNDGTSPASEIRVNAHIPDCLHLVENWPEEKDIPVIPRMPVPEAPRCGLRVGDALPFLARSSLFSNNLLTNFSPPNIRTSGFYAKADKVVFWADKLLHKHTIVPKDRVYLLARPDSKPGIYEIACNVFCVEYEYWDKILLSIEIIE